ncbi:D-aminoacyl-tRNA deacylase [Sporocytophaga myxococcoides]|uniref:D-aminoacyl-tRNA deacylase n=1 Tax=Sporocytophaga myxococcoides TaxID=153721 RepID=UPI0004148DC2|nr:D-aminoacyl-tRNA deacylase [Sporocytophaga myxococcoides]
MIAVIQRVKHASVTIDKTLKSSISEGLLVLLGIAHEDTQEDSDWLTKKIINLRIFSDADGKMNLSLKDINGDLLVVSQFTLHASTKKGNRPSFIEAARPEKGIPMYEQFVQLSEIELGKTVYTGEFGADMQVQLLNDGPVTIIIDTKNKN